MIATALVLNILFEFATTNNENPKSEYKRPKCVSILMAKRTEDCIRLTIISNGVTFKQDHSIFALKCWDLE